MIYKEQRSPRAPRSLVSCCQSSPLSGGQQPRAAIGRALITKLMLVLADEPTGNLDSKNSRDVTDLLYQASRHYRQTVRMIPHNVHLTSSVDRVLRVTDGTLCDLGGVQE